MNQYPVEMTDITKPAARRQALETLENELLVLGVPVYMGRVPALFREWLHSVKACNTPVVCIVVYGNRAYDNALLELKDILLERGCIPIAGAAYIGEHSYSSSETPIAEGRPDTGDLSHAELFGRKINEKLKSVPAANHIPDLKIPGTYPYEGNTELWNEDFIATSNVCTECGICAQICPVGAIDSKNSSLIDKEKCITCCACIKKCPENAKKMKSGPVKQTAGRLSKLHFDRKEPEFFL